MKRRIGKRTPEIAEFRRWALGYGGGALTLNGMIRAAVSHPEARAMLIPGIVSVTPDALAWPSLRPDPLPDDNTAIPWPKELAEPDGILDELSEEEVPRNIWEPESLRDLLSKLWMHSPNRLWVRGTIASAVEYLPAMIEKAVAAARAAVPAQAEAIERLGQIILEQACAHQVDAGDYRRQPIFLLSHPGYGASYILRTLAKALGCPFLAVGDDQTRAADLVKIGDNFATPMIQVHGVRSSEVGSAMNSIVGYFLHGHSVVDEDYVPVGVSDEASGGPFEALMRRSFVFFRLTPPIQPADATDYSPEEMASMLRDAYKRESKESWNILHADESFWTLIRNSNSVLFRRTPARFLVQQLLGEFADAWKNLATFYPSRLKGEDEMRLAALFVLERGYPSPKDVRGAARRFVLSLSDKARSADRLEFQVDNPEWQALFAVEKPGSEEWYVCLENMVRQYSYRGNRLGYETTFSSQGNRLVIGGLVERAPKAVTGGVFLQLRPTHRFIDVAGHEEAKSRFQQILAYFRNPEPYHRLGVIPPLRILLHGSPGTGKTLLAKALAGESGLPFFAISAGEFMTQEYAGQGAGLMRQFFQTAETCRPCIVFMDELDALGKRDSMSDTSAGVDYRATLNTLLTLLDGIQTIPDILVIGATNRPEDIDPALLRPGRFGTHIEISKLTVRDRERLIRKNLAPEHCGDDYDELVRYFCRRTTGVPSAAEIVQIITEAKLQAVQEGQAKVTRDLLVATADRILLGKKLQPLQEDLRRSTAIHEAGHALLCRILLPEQKIDRVTIGHRETSLGLVRMLDDEEHLGLQSRDELLCHLLIRLGGVTAEEVIMGHWDLGGSDDFDMAVAMARHALGNLDLGGLGLRAIVRSRFESGAPVGGDMEELTVKMMDKCRRAVAELLQNNKESLLRLADELERREDLDQEDVDGLLRGLKVDRSAILWKLLD